MASDLEAFLAEQLAKELATQARTTPVPPWIRFPEIERYSIGWRMGSGESYLMVWWAFAERLDTEDLVTYFREFAPLPLAWVDFAGMAIDLPLRDAVTGTAREEPEDWGDAVRARGDSIAHLALFDAAAWRAYLDAG
ncbi:MAG: hypothetical protein WKG01_04475 [Kofleriaceae bacterium]